jgi:hypothetical protein
VTGIRPLCIWLASLSGALLSSGCVAAGNDDVYSRVEPHCMDPVPQLGELVEPKEPTQGETYLTFECREALEAELNFDEESFKRARPGFKERVLEAYHALIAYPLVIPEKNELLGVSKPRAGIIPLDHIKIFRAGDSPNQAIFNFVANRLLEISYGEETETRWATYKWPNRIQIHSAFWADGDSQHRRDPFMRTATLVHEAYHAQGTFHEICETTGALDCDPELQGAYGFELIYFHFLLRGSGPALEPRNLMHIASYMGNTLKQAINDHSDFDEALSEVDLGNCDSLIEWITRREAVPYDKTCHQKVSGYFWLRSASNGLKMDRRT